MRRILTYSLRVSLLLVIILLTAGLLTQTRIVKQVLAGAISRTLSATLNGRLSIAAIDGNLFSTIELHHLELMVEQDTAAVLPYCCIHYSLRPLLRKQLHIRSIVIDSSTFNLTHLMKLGAQRAPDHIEKPSPKRTRAKASFPWQLRVDQFKIHQGEIGWKIDQSLPQKLQNLDLQLSATAAPPNFSCTLQSFQGELADPTLVIKNLSFQVDKNDSGITLRQFSLHTSRNAVSISAQAQPPLVSQAQALLQTDSLQWDELKFLLPTLRIPGRPAVSLHASRQHEQLQFAVNVVDSLHLLQIEGHMAPVEALFADSLSSSLQWDATARFRDILISEWLAAPPVEIRLNGDLDVHGRGRALGESTISARINLFDSGHPRWMIDQWSTRGDWDRGLVAASGLICSSFGAAEFKLSAHPLAQTQPFQLQTAIKNLNLAAVSPQFPSSALNLTMDANGHFFDPRRTTADVRLNCSPSILADISFDTLSTAVAVTKLNFLVDHFYLARPDGHVRGQGLISLEGNSDLTLHSTIMTLTPLAAAYGVDSLQGDAQLTAHLSGKSDSLSFSTRINSHALERQKNRCDSLSLQADGHWIDNRLQTRFDLVLQNNLWSNVSVNSARINGSFSEDTLHATIDVDQKQNRIRLQGKCHFGAQPTILIPDIQLQFGENRWQGGSETTRVVFKNQGIWVDDLEIHRPETDMSFRFYAQGFLGLSGEQNFELSLQGQNLSTLAQVVGKSGEFGGSLSLDARITGAATDPICALTFDVDQAHYQGFSIAGMHGSAHYADSLLTSDLVLTPQSDSLILHIKLPLILSPTAGVWKFPHDQPLQFMAEATNIRLQDLLPQQRLFDEFTGDLSFYFKAHDTWDHLQTEGFIRLLNGRLAHHGLGFRLDNLQMLTTVTPTHLILEQLSARRDQGTLKLQGTAGWEISPAGVNIQEINLTANAEQLLLSNRPEHEVQIQADVSLSGDGESPRVDGQVTLQRALMDIDYLLRSSSRTTVAEPEKPLLVQSLQLQEVTTREQSPDTVIVVQIKKPTFNAFKKLTGALKIEFPRNIWVKNKAMRIELAGAIDAVKTAENIELFGAIRVLRGQYDFLGRRFKVTRGHLTFQGGSRINPSLDIEAEYTLRGRDKKSRIALTITGKAIEPRLQFTLDGTPITEGEAASLILFGRMPDEMISGEQPGTEPAKQLANDLLYGMLSARVESRIGRTLGLDVVEIKGEENLNAATFVVGKYLTPELFMSYEHSIGTLEEDRPPHVVTIEYQLGKYLYLQFISGDTKSTGIDAVLKFTR